MKAIVFLCFILTCNVFASDNYNELSEILNSATELPGECEFINSYSNDESGYFSFEGPKFKNEIKFDEVNLSYYPSNDIDKRQGLLSGETTFTLKKRRSVGGPVPSFFNTRMIVRVDSENEISYLKYHLWITHPFKIPFTKGGTIIECK